MPRPPKPSAGTWEWVATKLHWQLAAGSWPPTRSDEKRWHSWLYR